MSGVSTAIYLPRPRPVSIDSPGRIAPPEYSARRPSPTSHSPRRAPAAEYSSRSSSSAGNPVRRTSTPTDPAGKQTAAGPKTDAGSDDFVSALQSVETLTEP